MEHIPSVFSFSLPTPPSKKIKEVGRRKGGWNREKDRRGRRRLVKGREGGEKEEQE